jgi:hypothetical protein
MAEKGADADHRAKDAYSVAGTAKFTESQASTKNDNINAYIS